MIAPTPNSPSPLSIAFLVPPSGLYRRDDRCQSRVEDQTVQVVLPPIDLALCAAVAREVGWRPWLRDYPAAGQGWDRLEADLGARRPDVLFLSTTTATARRDLEVAAVARSVRPEAVIVARGETLADDAAAILRDCPALDVIVRGEAEAVMGDLLARAPMALGGDRAAFFTALEGLPGVAFRRCDGAIHVAPDRAMVADLDALPLPARDLLDNHLYRSPETGRPLTVILANRGCPSRCVFCPAGAWSGYRVRFRSPESIVTELGECVERFGTREFLFHGDTFTIRKSWLNELCHRIEAARLDITWACNSRVDTLDEERAVWMRRAGCRIVAFGVESGSQEMLDRMGKNQRVEQAVAAVDAARRAGLLTHTFYIIGLPWETRETLAETLAFARRLDADFFDFNVAYPLPGTALWDLAHRDGLFEGTPPTTAGYAQATLRTYALSADELTRWRRKALLRMYLRPRYVARTLWRARSPRMLWHYGRAAMRRLWALGKG